MAGGQHDHRSVKKKDTGGGRPLTAALFYLRCLQLGLSISDTDLLSIGEIFDMVIEAGNDQEDDKDTVRQATQADFDRFKRG